MDESPSCFSTSSELINAFHFQGDDPYCRITPFTSRNVGFSVQSKYLPGIGFAPPKNKRGEDDVVTLIHVLYAYENEMKGNHDSKVPLIVRVGTYSRYRENHFDYNFSDEDCPTQESIEKSKQTPWPVDLEYYSEFFYDNHAGTFLDKNSRPIEGLAILDRVFEDHCKTIHWFHGLGLRIKLRTQKRLTAFLGVIIDLLIRAQKSLFGRELDESATFSKSLTGYSRSDFKKLSTESLNIFGYKASKTVIIIFCAVTAVTFALKFRSGISVPYLKTVFSNSFLTLTHSILVIWFLDLVLPNVLFYMINVVIILRARVIFKKRGR